MADFLDEALAQSLRMNPYARAGSYIAPQKPVYQSPNKYENATRNNILTMLASGLGGALQNYGTSQALDEANEAQKVLYQALQAPSNDMAAREEILASDPTGWARQKIAENEMEARLKMLGRTADAPLSSDVLSMFSPYFPGIEEKEGINKGILDSAIRLEAAKQDAKSSEKYFNSLAENRELRRMNEERQSEKFELTKEQLYPVVEFNNEAYKPLTALTTSQANKFSDFAKSYSMMNDAHAQMQDILDKNDGVVPDTGRNRTKYNSLYSKWFSAVRKLDETGMKLEPAEEELIKSQLPATIWTDTKNAALNKLLGATTQDELNKAKNAADLTMRAALKAGRFSLVQPLELKGSIYEGVNPALIQTMQSEASEDPASFKTAVYDTRPPARAGYQIFQNKKTGKYKYVPIGGK